MAENFVLRTSTLSLPLPIAPPSLKSINEFGSFEDVGTPKREFSSLQFGGAQKLT